MLQYRGYKTTAAASQRAHQPKRVEGATFQSVPSLRVFMGLKLRHHNQGLKGT